MSTETNAENSIGLLLQRSITALPRETLDWPLALLSMDWQVMLFVSGPALVQLPRQQHASSTSANAVPADQHRAWSRLWLAAAELGAELIISTQEWSSHGLSQAELALSAQVMTPAEISARQQACRHLLNV